MGQQFKITLTVNFSDDTEVNDLELENAVTAAEEIGPASLIAAESVRPEGAHVTSLVIVAVVA